MATKKKAYGDFQTPAKLSRQVCQLLANQGINPVSIVEPSCGQGSFIFAALECFPQAKKFLGLEINPDYIQSLKQKLNTQNLSAKVKILQADFFEMDWASKLAEFPQPILIIGNPPWVTNSALGALNSSNVPAKTNFQNHSGLDALTGKSNFDISEWMLLNLIQQLRGQNGVLAMLVKTSVARKVLKYLWHNNFEIGQSYLYLLDGKQEFDVSVNMGLFVCYTKTENKNQTCEVYDGLNSETYLTTFGFSDGHLISNMTHYKQWKHLMAMKAKMYQWRSGIKHDAVKIMELTRFPTFYKNGLAETCQLEDDYLYPLLKSSDLAKGLVAEPRRWVVVPQSYVGESTKHIKYKAPKTWDYLNNHKSFFDKRKSSIYKGKPEFSIFGVGAYSFALWKVAISGLYKNLKFVVVGPYEGKPIILDDTCYSIACKSKVEADFMAYIFNSAVAQEFLSSFIFWDSKRPITVNILEKLNIEALVRELGLEDELKKYTRNEKVIQLPLLPT